MFKSFNKNKTDIKAKTHNSSIDRGILVFEHTSEVIEAEKILKKSGRLVRVMGPPPEIQTGCDLVIEFPLIEELNILRELKKNKIKPLSIVPVTAPLLEPVDLFHSRDYGEYFMVRAANMKITIEKKNRKIVNISGGGCPDVPYVAWQMIGKSLAETQRPSDLGFTLCAYALDLAYEELCRKC